MNRVEPAHVPGCFKMFKITGTHREQPGRLSNTDKLGRRREQPCLHRDGVGAIPAQSRNIRVSTVINRAVPLLMYM